MICSKLPQAFLSNLGPSLWWLLAGFSRSFHGFFIDFSRSKLGWILYKFPHGLMKAIGRFYVVMTFEKSLISTWE